MTVPPEDPFRQRMKRSSLEGQRGETTFVVLGGFTLESLRQASNIAHQSQLYVMSELLGWQKVDHDRSVGIYLACCTGTVVIFSHCVWCIRNRRRDSEPILTLCICQDGGTFKSDGASMQSSVGWLQ